MSTSNETLSVTFVWLLCPKAYQWVFVRDKFSLATICIVNRVGAANQKSWKTGPQELAFQTRRADRNRAWPSL